ncbi:MarR family transcriptional regulator [Allokutzneria sp. A3M-2-11 16]|uniref:MarR family winged helix-turn-helix transcriptional regulator n=1 Tax=Allokutzneria sp. A3M-2-11 16 TaxID=2962043 RepID=UPI0020B64236|nr:MarR family transcriptional regulator [Allokutzneria sp. A3M-2-11 16]MCP3803278.1 MarR family transcriptional regulator [Allokutzneria sp. A3M-2-11 16]
MELIRAESLGYQVNLAARVLEQALRERVERHGVVPGQFPALLSLYERDGLTQAELCRQVRVEQPTMAKTLQRMERDGLIRRERHPTDARQVLVFLTERAEELREPLARAGTGVNADAVRGLTEEQVATLMTCLTQITDNLAAPGRPRSPR